MVQGQYSFKFLKKQFRLRIQAVLLRGGSYMVE
jgi:hypothetical protein